MTLRLSCLNAPYGARCFLTGPSVSMMSGWMRCLNAPYGARCFLTCRNRVPVRRAGSGLNAPYGARCFLTCRTGASGQERPVLMHLMALGAF